VSHWPEVPLREVAGFTNGLAFKPSDWSETGTRIIRIQNLNDANKPYNRTQREVPEKIHVQPGDLLVSWSASLGVYEWSGDDMAVLNQHIFRVEPDERVIVKQYLKHLLVSALTDMERHLHGATMKHVNRSAFINTIIPLPSLDEQLRIARMLDATDELRVKRRKALSCLRCLTKAIFNDMFGKMDADGRSEVMLLPDAYWFQEGPGVRKWQFQNSGVKLLNVANILKDGTLNLSKTDKCLGPNEVRSRYEHFLIDEGDLVIASSGISFDDDGMLRTRGAFVESNHLPLCMNTSTIRFKAVDGRSNLAYLKQWLETVEFRSQISRRVTGSAQQNFGPSHLRELWITLPPVDAQQLFDKRVAGVECVRTVHRTHLGRLDALFASLQDRAFRGEL